ncbi:Chemotaxis protein methyltransferase CheR [hydrothermal vent metagenome]|uniref:Chemotaxis protein methyltransferase CheR n=1 Tax=hydrothermal vent metagenome TaxID=652676 RepID=A0A3B1BM03_9ZZZZ
MRNEFMQNKIMQGEILREQYQAVTIPAQVLGRIETILKETMGLHSASIGSSAISSAVQRRISARADSCADAYFAQLLVSERELEALIEAVVIPETWFFRERKAFDALQHFVCKEWLPNHTVEVLRVLSLPCSTGEEPYSIAMTLMDAGLPVARFHIDALDISVQALARARRAVYGDNAFRDNDIAFRERFFQRKDVGYELDKTIRQNVNFIQGNILNTALMPGQGLYDVVFCRNLMIYFDRITQTQTVAVLSRLLKATGILFVGHAESSMILNHGYVSEHVSRAFAFRKARFETESGLRTTPGRQQPAYQPGFSLHDLSHKEKIRSAIASPPQLFPQALPLAKKKRLSDASLEQAFRLANEGSLAEAASLCEDWLQHNAPCVQAYYLLGLIREAAGSGQQAEEYLRKAVYLQPDHQEALIHLALLVEQRGDTAAAEVLYQRAQRAAEQYAATQHRSYTGT